MAQIGNLAEAEKILAGHIPQVRELLGKDLTLIRMTPLLKALGNPHDELKIIHVAGTSGKTSTTYYIASLLKTAGLKVGHTVSPHVDSITERVQIGLEPLSEQTFCTALSEFLDLIADVDPKPTYFELIIAFVYWYFAKERVDYAVIETGLGGRFDATNMAGKLDKICVITDIGLDHTHVLGNTLAEIAGQKAGIISPGNDVFTYDQSPAVMEVFRTTAIKQHAILNVLSVPQTIDREPFLGLPLYQQRNWSLAHQVYEYIAQRDSLPAVTIEQQNESMRIQVPGRMEVTQVGDKTVVMDGAHNEQKMAAFVTSFQKLYPNQKVTIILSLKKGKEYQTVLPLLKPICDKLIITGFKVMQDVPAVSMALESLAAKARELGLTNVTTEKNYNVAYDMALASQSDTIVVTGSFYLLASLRPYILGL